jgi:two-component system chemotaxis sensor kinase CheA
MDDMNRFKEIYITECFERLEDMEENLLELDEHNPNIEGLNAIFRCAHSIKGAAGSFGFNKIKDFTHILEGLLDGMREGHIAPTRKIIDTLLASVDIVRQMVTAAQTDSHLEEGFGRELAEQLKNIAADDSVPANATTTTSESIDEISIYDINFKPKKDLFFSGNEPLLIINELRTIGNVIVQPNASSVPELSEIDPESCYLSWNFTLETEKPLESVKEVFEFVENDCDLVIHKIAGFSKQLDKEPLEQKAPANLIKNETNTEEKPTAKDPIRKEVGEHEDPASKLSHGVTSIRIDVNKVDRLVNMVGEIVITQAMIGAQASKLHAEEHPELMHGLQIFSQYIIELQEAVMSVRMQPVKSIFSRMPRIVRDLSNQLGKDIRLEMYGENTEIDKTVIEQLSDPLMHMIRNSVDHGMDTPESRVARGKPAQGVIILSAEQTGGKIVIKITDDGLGINHDKVLKKAKEKGLVPQDAVLTDDEIHELIFTAGFSTADTVSDISGRGVGMDVAKSNIENIGGTINVISKAEEGTTFIVTLPLTMAILDGMIVRVGEEKYIVPINDIIETLKPEKKDIRQIAGANDLINVRGEFVQLVYLYKTFKIKNAEQAANNALIVIVQTGTERFGLVVDELIGQQQVVIKSLEENSQSILGISAATILGDGRVSLILDITQLRSLSTKVEQEKCLAEI